MTTKEKWILAAIIIVVIVAILAAIKLIPFYATIIALVTYVFGIGTGWFLKRIKDKYFVKS